MKPIIGGESMVILVAGIAIAFVGGMPAAGMIGIVLLFGLIAVDQLFRPDTFGGLLASIAGTIVIAAIAFCAMDVVYNVTDILGL